MLQKDYMQATETLNSNRMYRKRKEKKSFWIKWGTATKIKYDFIDCKSYNINKKKGKVNKQKG